MHSDQDFTGIWQGKILENDLFGTKYLVFQLSHDSDRIKVSRITIDEIELEATYTQVSEFELGITWNSNTQQCRFTGKLLISKETISLCGFWYQFGYVINKGYVSRIDVHLHPDSSSPGQYISEPFDLLTEHQTFFFDFSKSTGESSYQLDIRSFERNLSVFLNFNSMEQITARELLIKGDDEQVQATIKEDETETIISLDLPIFGEIFPIQLKRLERDEIGNYYGRDNTNSKNLRFSLPHDLNDGLKVGTKNIIKNRHPLEKLIRKIAEEEFPNIQAFLLLQRDALLVEEYFYGYEIHETHDTRSLSKSFTSTLIGMLHDQKMIPDINTPILEFTPGFNRDTIQNWDDRKEEITLKHLMTMSSGLAMDDFDDDSPGHEDKMYQQDWEKNWYKYILDLPIQYDPGTVAHYGTGGVNLLGSAIQFATKSDITTFVHDHLFAPLGIEHYYLNLTPQEEVYLGGGWYLRPRDLAKFGVMMNNEGVWQGKQILSAEWIRTALHVYTTIGGENYCLNWWHVSLTYKDSEYEIFYASGNGGQYLMLVPELHLTLVLLASNYMQFGIWSKFRNFMQEYIFPALLG